MLPMDPFHPLSRRCFLKYSMLLGSSFVSVFPAEAEPDPLTGTPLQSDSGMRMIRGVSGGVGVRGA